MNRTRYVVFALMLPLTGCISFGPKPPPHLMALTATTPLSPGTTHTTTDKGAVMIARLSAIPALVTQRVLVTDGPTEVAYLKDALWATQPADLFRGLLSETVTVKTGRVVTDQHNLAVQPDTRLSGQLSAFGLDGPGNAVVVTFDGTIAHAGSDRIETRRFSEKLPVTSEKPDSVAVALNQAANDVAGQVADWVGK